MNAPPRLVVVGLGHRGASHASKILRLEQEGRAKLAGLVDVVDARVVGAAADLGRPAWPSIEAIDVPIDAVVIATPTQSHLPLAQFAMTSGWHVLLEKPMAASVREAESLVAISRELGRHLQIGHSERYNPALAAALPLIDRPRYLVAERLGPFTGRGADDDVILDLMIHDLDLVATLFGTEVEEVRAIGVSVLTNQIDMASARLAFADGAVAQLSATRASLEPSRKIRVFTKTRYLSIDCLHPAVKSVRRELPAEGGAWPAIVGEPVVVEEQDALLAQLRDFADAIASGRRPAVDGEAGLRALRLCEQVRQALVVPDPD